MTNARVMLAVAFAMIGATSPVVAKGQNRGDDVVIIDGLPISRARAQALRECSALEANFNGIGGKQLRWGVRAVTLYRSCMARHGQVE